MPARTPLSRSRRNRIEAEVTFWLKIVALVVLAWLCIARVLAYFALVKLAFAVAIGGLFVAYFCYPLVRRLNARLPLWASISIVYAALGTLVGLWGWFLMPILATNLHDFLAALPSMENKTRVIMNDPRFGFLASLPQPTRLYLESLPNAIGTYIQSDAASFMGNLLAMLVSALALTLVFVAIPVVSIYMLTEAESLKRFFLGMLPAQHRERGKRILGELDGVLGGFIRGQLLIALSVGVLSTLMLMLLHVPFPLLIGAWAGLTDIVPYLGAFAGAIPAIAIALASNGIGDATLVAAGFVAINQLEGNLLAPRIVSRAVRISPLLVIFALLIGGELFGVIGMLIAVPMAGVLRVIVDNVRPPDALTNAEVEPGLTKAPKPEVDPHGTTSAVTTGMVEEAIAALRGDPG